MGARVGPPTNNLTSSTFGPNTPSSTGKDRHYGRDAAIGAGGIGAAGLAGR